MKKFFYGFLVALLVFNFVLFPPKKNASIIVSGALAFLTTALGAYVGAYLIDETFDSLTDDTLLKESYIQSFVSNWDTIPNRIMDSLQDAIITQIIEEEITSNELIKFDVPVEFNDWVIENYTITNPAYNGQYDTRVDDSSWGSFANFPGSAVDNSLASWGELHLYMNQHNGHDESPVILFYSQKMASYVIDTSASLMLYDFGPGSRGIQFVSSVSNEYIVGQMSYDLVNAPIYDNFNYSTYQGQYDNNYNIIVHQAFQTANFGKADAIYTLKHKAIAIAEQKNRALVNGKINSRFGVERSVTVPMDITSGVIQGGASVRWLSPQEAVSTGVIDTVSSAPAGVIVTGDGTVVDNDTLDQGIVVTTPNIGTIDEIQAGASAGTGENTGSFSLGALLAALPGVIADGISIAFAVPSLNDIQTGLNDVGNNFRLKFINWPVLHFSDYQGDMREWPGLKAAFPHLGVHEEVFVVDPTAPNHYANKMKSWIGAMLYFLTALLIYRRAHEILKR